MKPFDHPGAHARTTMLRLKNLAGACCLLGLTAGALPPATAQPMRPAELRAPEVRVVVVDVERLLFDSPRARAAAARLEAEFKPRRENIQAELRTLREMSEKLTRDAPGLTEREQLLRARELGERERNLRRAQAQMGEDFAERQVAERAALVKRIHDILQQLPRQLGVDLVLTRTIWHRATLDVTDKVATMLDG